MQRLLLLAAAFCVVATLAPVCSDEADEVTHGLIIYGMGGPASLPEMVAGSSVVARVRLVEVSTSAVEVTRDGGTSWLAALEFTFDVLEYIKGSGASRLTALARGAGREGNYDERVLADTRSAAVQKAQALLEVRDSRWDDRDGIVFLRGTVAAGYRLGEVGLDLDYQRVTVASGAFKAWLPQTATTTASGARSDGSGAKASQVQYYFEDPLRQLELTGGAGGGARQVHQQQRAIAVLALSEIREMVAAIERWVTTSGDTPEVRECIYDHYEQSRIAAHNNLDMHTQEFYSVESGQPAGSDAFQFNLPREALISYPGISDIPEDEQGRDWFEGPDAHLFNIRWYGIVTFTRPLPAGTYRFFWNYQNSIFFPCNAFRESSRNVQEKIVTVTAPAGTLAESFFDPHADGAAVTGTTTVGTISWQAPSAGSGQAGRVTADLDIDVTAHALDFIGLDGTTTVSLVVADATESAGTLSWTAPTQPWSAGDQLMLRVRRSRRPHADADPHAHAYPHSHAYPHTDAGAHADTDRQAGGTFPGQP